jgi:amino acid permease
MATAELSRSLKSRHLTMMSIGAIIGTGLFPRAALGAGAGFVSGGSR